jgi:type IV pilus assembly protein PilA
VRRWPYDNSKNRGKELSTYKRPLPLPSRTLILASLCGLVVWFFMADAFYGVVTARPLKLFSLAVILPPLLGLLVLSARFAFAQRWLAAFCVLAVAPFAILAHFAALSLIGAMDGRSMGPLNQGALDNNVVIASAAIWLAIGLWRYPWSRKGSLFDAPLGKQIQKSLGLLDLFLVICLLGIFALLGGSTYDPPTVRSRVSELILAGSSAKTGLSEGMQTYGSWSPEWMSAITISPTGMVSSASIGPTGQIIVYGTAPTSGSVVSMTPTITIDNKLVWSCTGRPVKYMPASCR